MPAGSDNWLRSNDYMYTKCRFGSIPDNEKWVERKRGGRAGRQVADVFFGCAYISAPRNRHVEFQESRGVGAGERGLERKGPVLQ